MLSMMKIKHDNIMIDHIYVVYDENETKFPYQIGSGAIYNELNNTMMWPIYTSGLHRNRNWTFETYLTRCALWWKLDKTTTWPIL